MVCFGERVFRSIVVARVVMVEENQFRYGAKKIPEKNCRDTYLCTIKINFILFFRFKPKLFTYVFRKIVKF